MLWVTFNRTSLELKHIHLFQTRGKKMTFNRTSLELKLRSASYYQGRCATFNRTSLELKLQVRIVDRFVNRLLIEPVWN